MSDHSDIDALASNLPAITAPPDDAPLMTRLWWAVRTLWSRVHIRRWRTLRSTSVWNYQQHVRTGDRRVRHRGSGHQPVNRAWLDGGEWREINPATVIPPRSPSAVTPPRQHGVQRLTALVNDAKDTPIPLLDSLAADIQAARMVGASGSNAASIDLLAMLRRRLLTDPPSVNASEIFADLGIDPDPPGDGQSCKALLSNVAAADRASAQGQSSTAMWANVRASRRARGEDR